MTALLRYLRIWLAQVRYSTVREMMFKSNFILWIIVDIAWFGLNICFIQFLYLQVDTIAGWTKWEMLLLVSTRNFEPGSVINTGVAGIVCVVAIAHLHLGISVPGLLVFPMLVVCGVAIHYAMLLILMSLAFWMTRAQGFINAYYNVFQIARLPREAFSGLTRVIFTWGVPLLLIANVPASTLLYGLNGNDLAGMAAATTILVMLSTLVFQAGLRRYGSASS